MLYKIKNNKQNKKFIYYNIKFLGVDSFVR